MFGKGHLLCGVGWQQGHRSQLQQLRLNQGQAGQQGGHAAHALQLKALLRQGVISGARGLQLGRERLHRVGGVLPVTRANRGMLQSGLGLLQGVGGQIVRPLV